MNTRVNRSAWLLSMLLLTFAGCKRESEPALERAEDQSPSFCRPCMEGTDGTPTVLENNGKKVTVTERNGVYYLQGDMMLSKEQMAMLKGETKPDARTGVSSFAKMWPNRTVFYMINAGISFGIRMDILDAISEWQSHTNLQFVERTTQANYVEFMPAVNECSSSIGMIGGRQEIRVSDGCHSWGIVHEIGHAIGFFHEQSRKDRWQYINIHTANIQDNKEHNFMTYEQMGIPGFRLGTLDFSSIMMYDSYAFSKNNQPTITRLDGSLIDPTFSLSAGDIDTYNHMYNRPYFEITQENIVTVHNSQETGSRWDCRFRAYTDASKTTLATLPWPMECWISYTWEDQSAPGGTMSPAKYLLSPGTIDYIIGEGYSLRERSTGIRRRMDYHIYNNGFGD